MSIGNCRPRMVNWYHPGQLARTGVEVLLSTIFGKYADQRLVRALVSGPGVVYDYTREPMQRIDLDGGAPPKQQEPATLDAGEVKERTEMWIDYVADVGDGWDSTYGVAYSIAHPALALAGSDGKSGPATKRGDVLIFGGDQVYPVASRSEYQHRLVEAYQTAFGDGPYPDVFAIPGNHDWYDSLVSFSRLFCSNEPFAGPTPAPASPGTDQSGRPRRGCRTPQRRSYFALRLPKGWWLLGTDVQLGSDIDGPQMDFFLKVADRINKEGGRVILCTPEPHWLNPKKAEAYVPLEERTVLEVLEEEVLGGRVAVFIAGDVHHYSRYEAADGSHKIIAGGGGAFLHPTHGPLNVPALAGEYKQAKIYPSPSTSWWLGCKNLLFLLWNPSFGLLTAVLYLLILWVVMPAIEEYPADEDLGLYANCFPVAAKELLWSANLRPGYIHHRIFVVGFAAVVALAFVLFTDLRGVQRVIVGAVHGLCHYGAALFIAWLGSWIAYRLFLQGTDFDEPGTTVFVTFWQPETFWFTTCFTFLAGWVVGSSLMGLYLFVMLNFFGRHWNEAFSSLKICDWKNFLRIKIGADGKLTIYPIGIRQVARDWRERTGNAGPLLEPVSANEAGLIEGPIEIAPRAPHQTSAG